MLALSKKGDCSCRDFGVGFDQSPLPQCRQQLLLPTVSCRTSQQYSNLLKHAADHRWLYMLQNSQLRQLLFIAVCCQSCRGTPASFCRFLHLHIKAVIMHRKAVLYNIVCLCGSRAALYQQDCCYLQPCCLLPLLLFLLLPCDFGCSCCNCPPFILCPILQYTCQHINDNAVDSTAPMYPSTNTPTHADCSADKQQMHDCNATITHTGDF